MKSWQKITGFCSILLVASLLNQGADTPSLIKAQIGVTIVILSLISIINFDWFLKSGDEKKVVKDGI